MTRLAHTVGGWLRRRRRRRIITWNAEVGRPGRAVRHAVMRMIREHNPDRIDLQEARGYRDDLADIPGYTLYSPRGKSMEAGNCIALIRDDRTGAGTVRKRALRLKVRWHGPKAGKEHPGRIFLETREPDWTFVGVHRTRPEWSPRGAAFAEEYGALLGSAQRAAERGDLWVCVGDQNIGTRPGRDRALHDGPWRLAETIGGRCITTTPGRIDYAVVGPRLKGKAKQLGDYGSDHNAVLIKIKETRR